MAGNTSMELYLAVGEMKPVSPNFNPPTLNQPISLIRLIPPTLNQPIFAYSIRAGRYQKFHITIIMTVNIPIIDIIAISAELTITVLQALKIVNNIV